LDGSVEGIKLFVFRKKIKEKMRISLPVSIE
jgi:hypothetical protein